MFKNHSKQLVHLLWWIHKTITPHLCPTCPLTGFHHIHLDIQLNIFLIQEYLIQKTYRHQEKTTKHTWRTGLHSSSSTSLLSMSSGSEQLSSSQSSADSDTINKNKTFQSNNMTINSKFFFYLLFFTECTPRPSRWHCNNWFHVCLSAKG